MINEKLSIAKYSKVDETFTSRTIVANHNFESELIAFNLLFAARLKNSYMLLQLVRYGETMSMQWAYLK